MIVMTTPSFMTNTLPQMRQELQMEDPPASPGWQGNPHSLYEQHQHLVCHQTACCHLQGCFPGPAACHMFTQPCLRGGSISLSILLSILMGSLYSCEYARTAQSAWTACFPGQECITKDLSSAKHCDIKSPLFFQHSKCS